MKNSKTIALTTAAMFGLACLLVGCSHEISHTETSRVSSDGTVKKKETTVTQQPDGTVTKTEETKKSTSQ